jgi:hypothetical protein
MFIPENIPPGRTAFAIITKPRNAEIIQPFKKGVYHQSSKPGPSGHKRPRIEEPSESGKILKNVYENPFQIRNICRNETIWKKFLNIYLIT